MPVPYFRPSITEAEIDEVVACLRSGWLTTGPRAKAFETEFAAYVGARHAVAVNSCTAALHLALEALGVQRGDLVVVPAMTFAATAEVVRYFDATPVLVDCDPATLCIDVAAARRTLDALAAGEPAAGLRPPYGPVRAILPVHFGGQMADMPAVRALADEHGLRVVEDAAHTLPAFLRTGDDQPWRPTGADADVACYSFYANKCITTGEGGMATTNDGAVAARMASMSLHGLSHGAWKRHMTTASWYYEIVAPGFKYNLTDVAAAIGLHQLRRAGEMWERRQVRAARYGSLLAGLPLELPVERPDRRHSWHLYAVRLAPGHWRIDRNQVIELLNQRGIGIAVQWMPLHLHPYYRDTYGYRPGLFPVSEDVWPRIFSLPLFPDMTDAEQDEVVAALRDLASLHAD